jgi:hypothetical protein
VTAAELDHVLVAVADLEAGARRFLHGYGLTALEGGRHPGRGTANRIVPLGGRYIELIAIVDAGEVARSHLGRRVAAAAESGRPLAGWAARTRDSAALDDLGRRLHEAGWGVGEVHDGSRVKPDGTVLRWRSMDLYPGPQENDPGVLPFLIAWDVRMEDHPGSATVVHPAGQAEMVALRFEDPQPELAQSRLALLLGDSVQFSVATGSVSGLVGVELRSPQGPLLIG